MLLAAVAMGAVLIDGGSPRAWAYIERCATADSLMAQWAMALRLDAHLQAFPATAAAMLVMCVLVPSGHAAFRWQRLVPRMALMLMSMVPVCVLAWWLASGMPSGVQAHGFAGAMLMVPMTWTRLSRHGARGYVRMRRQGLP